MTITETTNKGLIQITVGTETGTWGPYVNNTTGVLDNIFGGVATIPLTNANVVLSSAQYQCNTLVFTGALSASVRIYFPSVGSFYTVQNLTSNTSLYTVTLQTMAGGEIVGAPPGEAVDILTDGTNTKFKNFGHRIGTYVDIAAVTMPGWITACTVQPYLYCDGSVFSSAVYPILTRELGTTTLPNCIGLTRVTLEDGTANNTVIGPNPGNVGGVPEVTYTMAEMPWAFGAMVSAAALLGGSSYYAVNPVAPSPQNVETNMPPSLMHGLTMIRSG